MMTRSAPASQLIWRSTCTTRHEHSFWARASRIRYGHIQTKLTYICGFSLNPPPPSPQLSPLSLSHNLQKLVALKEKRQIILSCPCRLSRLCSFQLWFFFNSLYLFHLFFKICSQFLFLVERRTVGDSVADSQSSRCAASPQKVLRRCPGVCVCTQTHAHTHVLKPTHALVFSTVTDEVQLEEK